MNEQDNCHENIITDLEVQSAGQIKGGLTLGTSDQDEEAARMLSTVSVKIRKPGK